MDEEIDETLIRQYLLGGSGNDVELCEDDYQRIEDAFLRDENAFEDVLAVEDDLIQDYVNHQLPPDEAERFERIYLQDPKKRQRVQFSQTLRKWIDRE